MKTSVLIAGLLLLLAADTHAMKFKNEANQVVQVSRIAVLAVSDPEIIKWRAEQDTKLRQPKANGFKEKFTGILGRGGRVTKRKYPPHQDVVSGKKPKFVERLYVEDDKTVIDRFKAKLKDLRIDGIYMHGKVENELFEDSDQNEFLLTHKFESEWHRAHAIKMLAGADGYIVPKIWNVDYGNEGPYMRNTSSMLVEYVLYDQEGRVIVRDNYTHKNYREIFTLNFGLKKTADKFADKLLQLEIN